MSGASFHFRSAVTIAAGLIIASGAAAAVFAIAFGDIRVFTLTFVVVVAVAVFLGLPAYFAARAARNGTPIVAAVIGFIVGAAIPAILILAGSAPNQASVGRTVTALNGSYTIAGWLTNLAWVSFFGLLGVGGALVFWLVVRRSVSNEEEGKEPARSRPLQTALLSIAAASVVAAAFAIPYATADRSCHNTLRDGRTSIGPVASFDLRVGVDQWQNVENEVQKFRRAGSWSVRSDVRTDESFPWLQISLCKEPGTNIFVQGVSEFNEVSFGVYQPQGGSAWRRDFRALHGRISARWPTNIVFKDGRGGLTTAPNWAESEKQR